MRRSAVAVSLAALVLLAGVPAAAQDRPAVVVTPGASRTFKVAVQDFLDTSAAPKPGRSAKFREYIENGLEFSGVVDALSHAAFLGPETSGALDGGRQVVCGDWSQIGADALVEGTLRVDTELVVDYRVWDATRCTRLARKRYRQPATADPAAVGRRIADDIVAAFLGVRGVSATELAFVSTRKGNTEIFVVGVDGSNPRAATANGSINAFPSWTPEGDGIVYTSYRHRDTPRLFLSSRGRGRPGRLLRSLRGGYAEYRGVYAPDGKSLLVVLSAPGAASDIYRVRPQGTKATALSRHRAIEVAPAWSPDGRQVAFASDRTGAPQIYLMSADGSNQRRLTFQGSYNSHPAWSPDGRWIAYESRIGGQFDIWLTDPEGSVSLPLVQHPRSDETPSWAPNSRKLAFSSRRRGRADIYVIDVNGENMRRITQGAGDNTSPSWGPFPR
ncbi:MAG: PD40 domain-containing protein [Deltaproteobacteria bacterium]|nr:PD40 domain-containing protein [Deltaproteobacteria bacterium]MBW2362919.1 PD40 domain-containing protein [Deltaproteobacteria bacterium]